MLHVVPGKKETEKPYTNHFHISAVQHSGVGVKKTLDHFDTRSKIYSLWGTRPDNNLLINKSFSFLIVLHDLSFAWVKQDRVQRKHNSREGKAQELMVNIFKVSVPYSSTFFNNSNIFKSVC